MMASIKQEVEPELENKFSKHAQTHSHDDEAPRKRLKREISEEVTSLDEGALAMLAMLEDEAQRELLSAEDQKKAVTMPLSPPSSQPQPLQPKQELLKQQQPPPPPTQQQQASTPSQATATGSNTSSPRHGTFMCGLRQQSDRDPRMYGSITKGEIGLDFEYDSVKAEPGPPPAVASSSVTSKADAATAGTASAPSHQDLSAANLLVEYATRKSMSKGSKTPAGARWLWEFVARIDVRPDGSFHMSGDKFQRAFDYNTGKWTGVRNPTELFDQSLADKDEAAQHARRLEAATTHYKDKGAAHAFMGTTFEGKFYKGMPIGCSHQWNYDDAPFAPGVQAQQVRWTETKVHTDRWFLNVTGRLVATHANEEKEKASSSPSSCSPSTSAAVAAPVQPGVYLLLGNQIATRLNEKCNAYWVALRGQMHYLGPEFDKLRRDMIIRAQVRAIQKFAAGNKRAGGVGGSGSGSSKAASTMSFGALDRFVKRTS